MLTIGWLVLMAQLEGVELIVDWRSGECLRREPKPLSAWAQADEDEHLPPRHGARRRWSEEREGDER